MKNIKDEELQEIKELEGGVLEKLKNNEDLEPLSLEEGLLSAAADITDSTYPIEIIRGGQKFFGFRIKPISQKKIETLRTKCTVKSKKRGVEYATDFDETRFLSEMIYEATIPEDREKIWGNPVIREKYNVIGFQAVDVLLKAMEKEQVIEYIEQVSGADSSVTFGELTKN